MTSDFEEPCSALKHHVFVYGTLKNSYWNQPFMNGLELARYLGTKCTASNSWGLWSGAKDCIPFVYYKPEGGSKIQGEHWLLDDVGMNNVRWLEGGYDEETVELEDGTVAFMFTYPAKHLPLGRQGIDFPAREGAISWPLL